MNSNALISSIMKEADYLIHSQEFCARHRLDKAFSRSRKLSFSAMVYFVLNAAHRSLSINYAQLRQILPKLNLPMVSKQALSKARQGISQEAFRELFRLSVDRFYQNVAKDSLCHWNGFHIYAIDGSTIQIPDSKENFCFFGTNPNHHTDNPPLASVSALYDVLNDVVVDISLYPYRHNERDSAKEHISYLPMFRNSIILFDRGYPSESMFRFLHQKGLYFLMRVPKTFKKAISPQTDSLFTYPAKGKEEAMTLRSLHFTLEDGSVEYLVTNLMPSQMEGMKFQELYYLRWGIESKYRELKDRLEIENYNGLKPVCIQQEFFTSVFLSNLTAMIKRAADTLITAETSKKDNHHTYQANRSFILNRIKSLISVFLSSRKQVCTMMIAQLIDDAARVISIVRINRKFGRYRKHDRRRYYMHMKSCI